MTLQFLRQLFGRGSGPDPKVAPRIKHYAAQTGYVYEYFVERGDGGYYNFRLSSNRSEWTVLTIYVPDEAVRVWEQTHQRVMRDQERYAAAKLALFAYLDEVPPERAGSVLEVTAEEVEGFLGSLDV